MNKVFNAKLNKKFLKSISKDERAFIFAMVHFSNEMNALNKLLLWTSRTPSPNRAEVLGRLTYQFMFIRYFAGKLFEGHQLFSKSFQGAKISKEYIPYLSEEGKTALKNINGYFSKKNAIYKIRNTLAFHYDPQKLDSEFIDTPDDFDIFLEEKGSSNNLFYFAEVMAGRALISESGDLRDKNDNPYENLIKEVFRVARWFSNVINEIFVLFANKYSDNIWETQPIEVEFENLISTLDIHIPWFTDISKAEDLF